MDFVVRVGTPEGRVQEQSYQAADEAALRSDLEKQGLHVFSVRRRGVSAGVKLPALAWGRRKVVNQQEFLIFNQELASLLKAGLPLLQSLDLMLERMENQRFRAVLTDIRARVSSGADLSDAFALHGEHFPRLYPASLKAGERSGELEAVVRRFIRYQRLVLEAKKRAVSALIYPAVLIGLSLVMLLILAVYVVPRFTEFYAGFQGELPLLTRITTATAFFLRDHIVLILAVSVVGGLLLRRWVNTPAGRVGFDRMKLQIPLIGRVLHLFALSEFCRSLSTLLAGGIPLVPAFEISTAAVGNARVRSALEPRIQMVRQGRAFYEAIEDTGVFPAIAVDMAKVGEATGGLDEMLTSVSDFFDDKVETLLGRILSLVEPAMLVFMGLVVAIILLSLYLPMFSMLGQVQG
ncbi:MAG TPA: type II secretion system F family protein [Thermoanaerobaculia bacterium]|nr:type II secretion system F family protein [Thermoanaerobaculia bacterium]